VVGAGREQPEGFGESKKVAKRGAGVAKTARLVAEEQTGRAVISEKNAKSMRRLK
jgi:hypothetical protein